MIVMGSHQELFDFLNTWVTSTLSSYPIVWFDECERNTKINSGNIPLVYIDCEGGDYTAKGWDFPASAGGIPFDLHGDGTINYRVRIDIIDFKSINSPVATKADIALTSLFLNLPHVNFKNYLGYNGNKAQILRYSFPRNYNFDGAEATKPLVLYRGEVLVSLALGQEVGGGLIQIPLELDETIEIGVAEIQPIIEREEHSGKTT